MANANELWCLGHSEISHQGTVDLKAGPNISQSFRKRKAGGMKGTHDTLNWRFAYPGSSLLFPWIPGWASDSVTVACSAL